MKRIQALCLLPLLATGLLAQPNQPSSRLKALVQALPPIGQNAEMKSMGLELKPIPGKAPATTHEAPNYKLYYPLNLDTSPTDTGPLAGKFPGMHLNIPLQVQPSYINFLFLSDQPERVLDTRKRTPAAAPNSPDPGPGATGIYALSPIPGRSTVRVLVDHTNGTTRPLRFDLMWIPENAGFLTIRKRSLSVHKDSVAAGSRAFGDMGAIVVEPRQMLEVNQGVALITQQLEPEETLVVHQEFYVSGRGQLVAIIEEVDRPQTATREALDQLPVLHSIVWKEEEHRLGQFIDKTKDPNRWNRIKESFQHARGHFPAPDRVAVVDYNVRSWKETEHPVRTYSKFESIPGVDVTVKQGDQPAVTDNRGKYGAKVGIRWNLKGLPPGCKEVALVAINRGAVFGGRHWVSDGRKTVAEVIHRPGTQPGVLRTMQASTLWRGPVTVGDSLQMWTEPMANTSVWVWYVLVPIPPQ